jgi:2'-deoxynucleoside 5'-phosphate N-hydrolase
MYAALVEHLLALGHSVPTAHLAHPEIMAVEAVVDAREVYERDVQWLDESEAVIAEVSTPSHGVGYEIAYALCAGRPVLCLYQASARVSKMLTGNTHPGLTIVAYSDEAGAKARLDEFLLAIEKERPGQ